MTVYYVSVTGSDDKTGTIDHPFTSLQHAHDLAQPGDTIYLRGGVYHLSAGIHLTKDGVSGKPITLMNYPGEVPVLDGSAIPPGDYYKSWVLWLDNVSWNHIKGLELTGGPDGGLVINGASHFNIIERLNVHHIGPGAVGEAKGISLYGASSNNLLLNNDSHHNRDLYSDNADGFQVSTVGTGNVLRGNRAWGNSDDGFDLFNVHDNTKGASVLIEGNWAFDNGYDAAHNPLGDGSGFKLGGTRIGTSGTSGDHIVINNVAWDNLYAGFDENEANRPIILYNNTAYDNGSYNFGFWNQLNIFRNNLSVGTGRVASSGSSENNSWTLPLSPSDKDFLSLNHGAASGPRAADGSLPTTNFLHLATGSNLIDKGIDVGLAYSGTAPDLGRFESNHTGFNSATSAHSGATTTAIRGGSKADNLKGTDKNDLIDGKSGHDTMTGGKGDDTYVVGTPLDKVVEKAGEGVDTVNAWVDSYTLSDNVENLFGMKSTGMSLTGNGLSNIIKGRAGNDTITGGSGADQLWGGAGRDSFVFKSLSNKGDVVMDFKIGEDFVNLRPLLSANGNLDVKVVAKGLNAVAVWVHHDDKVDELVTLMGVNSSDIAAMQPGKAAWMLVQ